MFLINFVISNLGTIDIMALSKNLNLFLNLQVCYTSTNFALPYLLAQMHGN